MALLSFVESQPRAYRLKAGNAASPISTSSGTIPSIGVLGRIAMSLSVDIEELFRRPVHDKRARALIDFSQKS
jgi:hypothetical protein